MSWVNMLIFCAVVHWNFFENDSCTAIKTREKHHYCMKNSVYSIPQLFKTPVKLSLAEIKYDILFLK